MNKNLTSSPNIKINKSSLDVYNMFQEATEKLYNLKILDNNDIQRIYAQRMAVLQYKLKLYTKDESSSVKYETAISMMKNIDYTLSVYLNSLPDIDSIADALKNKDINSMNEEGYKIIKDYLEEGKILLQKVQDNKLYIDNIAYLDTIERGLPMFFKKYDAYFNPLETDADIDYPVKDKKVQYEGCGIIYVMRYMKCLYLENKFLKYFDENSIITLLKSYDTRYKELLINIFTILLINATGILICGLNPLNLNLSSENIKHINDTLCRYTKEDLYKIIYNSVQKLCTMLNITDKEVINYVIASSKDITDEIYYAISTNKIEIAFTAIKDEKFIIYNDHECLSDKAFREISDGIYSCSNTEDKIAIMNKYIKSFYDMIDILESDCFLRNEYGQYYESLDLSVIVLLYKHMNEYDLYNDKECYECLNEFIYNHDLKEKID